MNILKVYRNKKRKLGSFGAARYLFSSAVHKIMLPISRAILFSFYPVDPNKVLFTSFPDFSDNSKVLYDYLRRNRENYHYTWIVSENAGCKSDNADFVIGKSKYYSGFNFRAMKEIATSKYIFFTHTPPIYELGKRKEQVVVNLWHGCGYKGRTAKAPKNPKGQFDYVLVPGKVFVDIKAKFFSCDKEQVIPIGYPRYDIFSDQPSKAVSFVNDIKNGNSKFVIWMPTYRKTEAGKYGAEKIDGYYELPVLNSQQELLSLNRFCRENGIALCIKRHPLQLRYDCESLKLSNICFISNDTLFSQDVDLYSVLQLTDGMISDYSSAAIDYVLLDKPLAFVLNDFKDYHDAQGFVFDDPLKYMPGYHLYTYEDMTAFLIDIKNGEDRYKNKRDGIFAEIHNPCADYCKRICDYFAL